LTALAFAVNTGFAGLIVLFAVCCGVAHGIALTNDGVRTQGTVVGFVSNRSCRSAEVGFRDRNGTYHQFNDDCPTSRKGGEKVPVVYVPSQPTVAAVDGEVWNTVVLLGLVALGLLGACVALLIKAWRARPSGS